MVFKKALKIAHSVQWFSSKWKISIFEAKKADLESLFFL